MRFFGYKINHIKFKINVLNFFEYIKKSSTYADIYIGLAEKNSVCEWLCETCLFFTYIPLKCSVHFQVRLTKWKVSTIENTTEIHGWKLQSYKELRMLEFP